MTDMMRTRERNHIIETGEWLTVKRAWELVTGYADDGYTVDELRWYAGTELVDGTARRRLAAGERFLGILAV